MCKNNVDPDRPEITIRRMRIAWWIPKATNTNSEYVIILYFSLKQWLQKRASKLRYTYIALLGFVTIIQLVPNKLHGNIFLNIKNLLLDPHDKEQKVLPHHRSPLRLHYWLHIITEQLHVTSNF